MQLENGQYGAKPTRNVSVYETANGALCLAIVWELIGFEGQKITSRTYLTQKDGTINTRSVEDAKAWSGWNGVDPFWFMDTDLTGLECELVVENEEYNGRMSPKVRWINKPGSGAGKALPDAADRKLILAKYGSKFRALSGGVPVKSPAAPKAPTTPPARKRTAKEAMEAAWAALEKATPDMENGDRETRWFALIDETGSPADALTADQWDAIRAKVESTADLPF